MSDTTGWTRNGSDYVKMIDGRCWWTTHWNAEWYLKTGITKLGPFKTLRECQELAHATARLWAGETE